MKKKPTTPLQYLLDIRIVPLVVALLFLGVQALELVKPSEVQASPTISTATTSSMTTSSRTVTYNAGTGTGRVLVFVVASDDRTNKMSSIRYGGVLMTEAKRQLSGGTTATAGVQIFYLVNPASGSNSLVFTASAADNYAYIGAYVSGADTTLMPAATGSNSASSGSSLSVSTTPTYSDSLIVAGFGSDSTTALTPSGGSTEVGEISATGIRGGLYTKVAPTAGVATSIAATGGSAAWGSVSIEIPVPPPIPTVTMTVEDQTATEPSPSNQDDTIDIQFARGDEDSLSSTIDVEISQGEGTATYYSDYQYDTLNSTCTNVTGDSLSIPSGQRSCELIIKAIQDDEPEELEYGYVILGDSSTYYTGGSNTALFGIYDYTASACDPREDTCGGATTPYAVASPGFASMYLYDDDMVPAGTVGTFTATPARVKAGQAATLSWSVTGMIAGCSINNGIGSVDNTDGTHTATTPAISQRVTYTLTCSDGTNTLTAQATVGIVPSFIEQ